MPWPSRGRSYLVSDDLHIGPSVLAPVKIDRSDQLGRYVVGPLALMLLVVVLVFYVFFSAHVVDGDSMLPVLANGDRLLATHGYDVPRRGDIIVFTLLDESTGKPEGLIKRVIALPGDTIEVRKGQAVVNGVPEPPRGLIIDPNDPAETELYTVPEGTLYVLGDNRPISIDSRQLGPIRLSAIRGRVEWIWSPINRLRRVTTDR